MLASIFSQHHKTKALILSIISVLPAGLIFLEPDLGMTLLIGFIWFSMLLASDVEKKYIFTIVGVTIAFIPFAFSSCLKTINVCEYSHYLTPKSTFEKVHTTL